MTDEISSFNRKAVASTSPGLPFRLPWGSVNATTFYRKAVAALPDEAPRMTQPRCG